MHHDPAEVAAWIEAEERHSRAALKRLDIVAAAVHSTQLEGLHISAALREGLAGYVDGELTSNDLVRDTLGRLGHNP